MSSVASAAARLARVALLCPVLAAPWLLGAVQAWAQIWVLSAVLVSLGLAILYLLICPWRRGLVTVPLAILPLLLAIGLGALHLLPLDRSTLSRVSPRAVEIADEFLPAADAPERGALATVGLEEASADHPTTVYPTATRQSLALLILAASVFFLAAVLFSRSTTHLWLLGLIAVNGAAIGFFGLAQNLTWNGQLYWNIVLTQGGGPFGPFVNRNNGGGYLVLCLAATIGLALWCLGHYFHAWDLAARSQREPREALSRSQQSGGRTGLSPVQTGCKSDPQPFQTGYLPAGRPSSRNVLSRLKIRIVSAVAELNAGTLTWLTIAGLLVAAICCTLSRGSVLAMLAAVLVTVTVMIVSQRRGLAMVWPAVAMAVGLFLIGWVGLSDEVGARLATLFNDQTILQEDRWPHWEDGLRAAADFPRAGSGLGTYRFVYASYQDRLAEAWFYYAEDVYLQVLVEAGIPGLVLFLAGLALIAVSVWRLLTRGEDLTTLTLAVTGVFALAGQAVAAMFDFGLLIPANFLLFAVLCGAIAGSAARLRAPRVAPGSWKPALNRGAAALIACGLSAGCVWGLCELQPAVPVEKAMRDVRLAGRLVDLSGPQLAQHIDELTVASLNRPDDAELHRRLAELWMQRYQLETTNELQARTSFAAGDPRLGQLASPLLVHQQAWLFTRSKLAAELAALRQSPTVQKNLVPALRHLVASRRYCPLLPEVHCGLAQLCAVVGPVSDDEIHIRRTRRLAPGNPDLLYICGLLDFQAARFESAFAGWKASLALSPRYLAAVLEIAGVALATPGTVEQLLPDDPELLVRLAGKEFAVAGNEPIQEQLLARAESLLPGADLPEAERLFVGGSILALRKSYSEAIDAYTQALTLRSYEVGWRYELARLLQQQGLLDEAHEQARRCARREPRQVKYQKLLEEIHDRQLRAEDRGTEGQRTEDRGQRTEDRGQRTEDRGQRTEDRGQRTGDRSQGTGDRGQGTEGQRTGGQGVRGQETGRDGVEQELSEGSEKRDA